MKKQLISIDSVTRLSVVSWSASEHNCRKMQLDLFGNWEAVEERDLSSTMQVYGYLQELRDESARIDREAEETASIVSDAYDELDAFIDAVNNYQEVQ